MINVNNNSETGGDDEILLEIVWFHRKDVLNEFIVFSLRIRMKCHYFYRF
jgi:hypothetical protein